MVFVKINGNRKVKSVKGGKFGYDEIGICYSEDRGKWGVCSLENLAASDLSTFLRVMY